MTPEEAQKLRDEIAQLRRDFENVKDSIIAFPNLTELQKATIHKDLPVKYDSSTGSPTANGLLKVKINGEDFSIMLGS